MIDDRGGEPNRCSAPFRVRFDEAGPDGRLRTSVLLRYAQDLAWFHSDQRGFDRAWYAERGLTWLVRAAEVAVLGPIQVGDALMGTTQVVGWRRVWARRRTEFRDAGGALVAWVHIDWVLLDARGAPTRIPPDFDAAFGTPAGSASLARVPLTHPPDDAAVARFAVRPQELDPMDHANNAVYADWLDEQVIAAGGLAQVRAIPRFARLEYARAAENGATVEARTWPDPDAAGWSCAIADAAGTALLRARLEAAPS
ncbi:MAG TPA: acyl-ACP thioesterase domain-containing protein [Candidatus Saccharimonadales bacterium]|nr:acyl-ACP thioesterase domain-containing protein [Candidatus Saccharimonadales bacterium]